MQTMLPLRSRNRGLIVSVSITVGTVFMSRASAQEAPPEKARAFDESPQARPANDGGVPIQRARIDAFIKQVAEYRTFDEVVAGMLDRPGGPDAFDIVFAAGLQTPDINPESHFIEVLADRRTAKLYDFLSREKPERACQLASDVFEKQLASHRKQWEQQIIIPKEGLGDRRIKNRLGMPLAPRYTRQATCVAMFLCACFCKPNDVLSKLAEWDNELADVKAQIDRNIENKEDLSQAVYNAFALNGDGQVQPLYRLNLMFILLDRRRPGLSQEVIDQLPGGIPRFFKLEQSTLCRWDAETNPFDFTAFHRGVLPDTDNSLLEIRFRRGWGTFQTSPEAKALILEKVSNAVREL